MNILSGETQLSPKLTTQVYCEQLKAFHKFFICSPGKERTDRKYKSIKRSANQESTSALSFLSLIYQ